MTGYTPTQPSTPLPAPDTDEEPDSDPAALAGEGSVTLFLSSPDTAPGFYNVRLEGVFADSLGAFPNLSDCWPTHETVCAPALPAQLDSFIDPVQPDPGFSFWPVAHDIGTEFQLGPFTAEQTGLNDERYHGTFDVDTGLLVPGEPLYLTLSGGSWGSSEMDVSVPVPEPMSVLEPLNGAHLGDEPVEILWEPGTSGTVLLSVTSGGPSEVPGAIVVDRLYRLEDDGSFLLDLSDVGFNDATVGMTLSLARVEHALVDVNGNPLLLSARSEYNWVMIRAPIDGRTRIQPADTCDGPLPELEAGSFWGRLDGYTNASDLPIDSCTGAFAQGTDGFFGVTLAPGERIRVEGSRLEGDGSLYLLEECGEPDTCVDGDDGGIDRVEYTNRSDAETSLILALDAHLPTRKLFLLDVVRDFPEMAAGSGGCSTDPQVGPGRHTLDYQDAIGATVPLGCGFGLEEAVFLPLEVPAMSKVIAQPLAPLVTSLLYDCNTCPGFAGHAERLIVENDTTENRNANLAFRDTGSAPHHGVFDAEFAIAPLQDADLAKGCGETEHHEVFETGWHWRSGSLEGFPNNQNIVCSSGNFSAEEGMFEVHLKAGETLEVEYTQEEAVGNILIARGCPDPVTNPPLVCSSGGAGATTRGSYTNHTDRTERLTVVLETDISIVNIPGGNFDLFVGIY